MTGDLLKVYREVRNNLNTCNLYNTDKAEISKESLEIIMDFMLDKDRFSDTQKVGMILNEKLHSLFKENRLDEVKELGNAYDIINKYTNNSLDLKENKTGHWIDVGDSWNAMYECSECGQNVMTGDIECYQFCHGCGAKMKGV